MLPAGRRQLRILVSAPGQLRAYLTADLLRRAAEVRRLLPAVSELLPVSADAAEPRVAALRDWAAGLNIHPPEETLAAPLDPLIGVPLFDVGIGRADEASNGDVTSLARLWIRVAPDSHAAEPGDKPGGRDEPLAVRLALMRHGYREPVGSGWPAAGELETLLRWRALVAAWAHSPSGAMSRAQTDAVTDAFANDLDTASALRALTDLADDPGVPDGVKFETFAAADRLLSLDLVRDIGK